jgi:amino acid adenylation domain-containing protein
MSGIQAGFLRSCERYPHKAALEVAGQTLTYAELQEASCRLAATLAALPSNGSCFVGVLASRSPCAYASVLGVLMSGRAVTPLNPSFPPARTLAMIEQAGLDIVVLDQTGQEHLDALLAQVTRPLTILLPESTDARDAREAWPSHRFFAASDFAPANAWRPAPARSNDPAYLLFTSGSTGNPKAVALLHRNLTSFIRKALARYGFSPDDRFSQFYDFTWDAHLFELFACWEHGGCLCVPRPAQLLNPDRFIREHRITVMDTVPSTGFLMARMGAFKAGRYPSLRIIRVGGEAVPIEQGAAWSLAAPNAILENTYGPTEATVEVTYYLWNQDTSPGEAEHGVMPIGFPYPGTELLVVDDQLCEVPVGSEGELLIAGEHLAPGYWQDPERTAAAFVQPAGHGRTFYRTGDRVRRPAPGGPLLFLGRNDDQIKIFGVRIEPSEVEACLRAAANTQGAVALGWPRTPSGAAGIVAFIDKPDADVQAILATLKETLPNVMVPREIRVLDRFPLNTSGKVDRRQLLAMLEAGA